MDEEERNRRLAIVTAEQIDALNELREIQERANEAERRRRRIAFLASFILTALTVSTVALGTNLLLEWRSPRGEPTTVEGRIEALTRSLNEAATTIGQIETEIEARRELAEQLQQDAEIAQNVTTLNREQVDAIAQTLRGELDADDRQSFWSNFWVNLLFVVLGIAMTELYHFFRKKLRARREAPKES